MQVEDIGILMIELQMISADLKELKSDSHYLKQANYHLNLVLDRLYSFKEELSGEAVVGMD